MTLASSFNANYNNISTYDYCRDNNNNIMMCIILLLFIVCLLLLLLFGNGGSGAPDNARERSIRVTIRATNINARERTGRVAASVAATNYDLRHKTTSSRTHTHLLIILNRLHS